MSAAERLAESDPEFRRLVAEFQAADAAYRAVLREAYGDWNWSVYIARIHAAQDAMVATWAAMDTRRDSHTPAEPSP